MAGFSAPAGLTAEHERTGFQCGRRELDAWFVERAQKNEQSGASRIFVSCRTGTSTVAGFYSLAASSVSLAVTPGAVRRNMPTPVPVVLLGRLAVDRRHQGSGLGASLLLDAIVRVAGAAHIVGVRAVLVHVMDDEGAAFYRRFGFVPSPLDDSTLSLPIASIYASVKEVVSELKQKSAAGM